MNTHSNADHIGGNRYLQGQTGCKVYSGGIEAAFTKYPVLEPSFIYDVGAYLEQMEAPCSFPPMRMPLRM